MTTTSPPAPLFLTTGEPAGIGPDLAVLLDPATLPAPVVLVGNRQMLAQRAALRGRAWAVPDYRPQQTVPLSVLDLPLAVPVQPGVLHAANAPYVLAMLDAALHACRTGQASAMVTAPVHKGIINDAGIPFSGHTEYLAEQTGTPQVVMMLAGGGLRVALATTHLPLRDVPAAITADGLRTTLRILAHDLRARFGIAAPRILVAGLNPHAGEGGHLGREEIDIIRPVLQSLRAENLHLIGPLPADTLFTPDKLRHADAVLAMYHDQGLPVLKHASFGQGVNVTLGLPLVRTSVDHGTALDLAGQGEIDTGSLRAALQLAAELSGH
jgi:4-hydroxythreonine-4-phosphate dehydrogenase